jgi:hypothetical protein
MKRFIIIEAILAGIKIVTVARQLGVSRSWASRAANASSRRQLLAGLFELGRERLNALFDQSRGPCESEGALRGAVGPRA